MGFSEAVKCELGINVDFESNVTRLGVLGIGVWV